MIEKKKSPTIKELKEKIKNQGRALRIMRLAIRDIIDDGIRTDRHNCDVTGRAERLLKDGMVNGDFLRGVYLTLEVTRFNYFKGIEVYSCRLKERSPQNFIQICKLIDKDCEEELALLGFYLNNTKNILT